MPIGKHYDLDTDVTLANNSDNTIASQKATKAYIDNNYIPASAMEEAATVAKTGDYNDLINKPTIPDTTNSVTSGSTAALTSGGAYTNLVRRKSTTAATGGANQGVYVDANGQVQTCNATTSSYSSTGTTAVNGTAVASALGSYIPRNFGGSVPSSQPQQAVASESYGTSAIPKGYFKNMNLLHTVKNYFYRANKNLYNNGTVTVTCNYEDKVANLGIAMLDGSYSGYYTQINPSTMFSEKPFVWQILSSQSFEVSDVLSLFIVGHRFGGLSATKFKIEVTNAYNSGNPTWYTLIDYSGTSVGICQKHFRVYSSEISTSPAYHNVCGIRLTISESNSTVFDMSEIMLLGSRGTENVSDGVHALDVGKGGKIVADLTIPTEYGSFIGNLTGTATKATKDADGNTISTTYLKSHQSIKTLNTNNTTAQTASASEAIAGSGSISLHKVSKTGSYDDLLNKPTIPTVNDAMLTIQQNGTTVSTFTANASSNVAANIITGVKELTAGTNIDNIREDGTFFIKNPTGTLPISICTWCIITQEKCYDNYGTYWYVQNGKFSYLSTMGVNQLMPWQLYTRQISDYQYIYSDWKKIDNLSEKVFNYSLSTSNSSVSMSLTNYTDSQAISIVNIGLSTGSDWRTVTRLELTGSFKGSCKLLFKTYDGNPLHGTGPFTVVINEFTAASIINPNTLTNFSFKYDALYEIDFQYFSTYGKVVATIIEIGQPFVQGQFPSQTGNSGKFLTTNGTTMSWATVGSGGTSNYNDLTNKPSINSVTLSGNKTGSDLGLVDESDLEEIDINNLMPSQSGNSGKFLSTNGSSIYWASTGGGGSGYVPMPTVTTLTDTTYTLTVAENTIYKFSNAITSLTISSITISDLESLIYFTTGSSITFVDNSTLKWGGGSIPSLDVNTTYCIAIKNGLAELDKFGR